MSITQNQIENVAIDYGIIYTNYGETDEVKIGPCRGDSDFSVDSKIRDIEYNGMNGKTKGMQIVEEINATMKVTVLDTSLKTLALSMPFATLTGAGTELSPYVLTCKSTDIGVISSDSYLKNVTMFCKIVSGEYRKITLFNAMVENKFDFKAKLKGETEVELEFNAHWDATDDTKDLYKIETVDSLV